MKTWKKEGLRLLQKLIAFSQVVVKSSECFEGYQFIVKKPIGGFISLSHFRLCFIKHLSWKRGSWSPGKVVTTYKSQCTFSTLDVMSIVLWLIHDNLNLWLLCYILVCISLVPSLTRELLCSRSRGLIFLVVKLIFFLYLWGSRDIL